MRLVSESILICSSNFPHKKPSSCWFCSPSALVFSMERLPQANSRAAVVWRAREIKEPPPDPTDCLALSPSISSTPQSASYTCTSCLPGLWQSLALHLLAYAWAGHVWIQRADREKGEAGRGVTARRFSSGCLEEPRHRDAVEAQEALAEPTSVLSDWEF